MSPIKHFIISFLIVTFAGLASVLSINIVYDPLWYFGGNSIGEVNYAFNERVSKLNLLKHEKDINCLILGSSKVTFLRASNVKNAKCFNLAVSGGKVEELIEFAQLIDREFDFKIDYLFIGVEPWDIFYPKDDEIFAYTPIKMPDSFLSAYLSLDALRFTRRLMIEQSPIPRTYDKRFHVGVIEDLPKFDPESYFTVAPRRKVVVPNHHEKYLKIVETLKPKSTVFFAPAMSAWHIERMVRGQSLTDYHRSLFKFAQLGFPTVDYSVLSEVTLSREHTWDGIHYYGESNRKIEQDFDKLIGTGELSDNSFGVLLNQISWERYASSADDIFELIAKQK